MIFLSTSPEVIVPKSPSADQTPFTPPPPFPTLVLLIQSPRYIFLICFVWFLQVQLDRLSYLNKYSDTWDTGIWITTHRYRGRTRYINNPVPSSLPTHNPRLYCSNAFVYICGADQEVKELLICLKENRFHAG